MEIKEELIGSIHKLILSGRMDVVGIDSIEMQLSSMCSSPRMLVVVDMSNVCFISAMGISALLISGKAVIERGGSFALFAPQSMVKEVLEFSGLSRFFKIFYDLDEVTQETI